MSLPDALAEDRKARESDYSWMLGRFVVPASLLAEVPAPGPPLSVILSHVDDVALVQGARGVEAVELKLPSARPDSPELVAIYRALRPLGVETYFELVLDGSWRESVPAAIGAVTVLGARVKLRCGGDSIPSIEQVALVIACCRESGVSFKATAGLHHPIRRGDEHGFLNLLAAATAPPRMLDQVLAEEDAARLQIDPAGRDLFTCFGSCSWREPVEELRDLGLLE